MFTLRAFPLEGGQRYELVEIPLEVLHAVANVNKSDLSPLTKAKGTRTIVKWQGHTAWKLCFDGSDDKITLAGLSITYCKVHAAWMVRWAAQRQEDIF